ncbi:carboxymuconolactone decarboxylase family protein [Rhodococcus sp. 1168]|uniref:carboxymuconolactone decarboxylase family protein n=1 Tax=Rhodococcus sp. 1168 TaxID=2018041 RepID=UPI000A0EC895|nr:carboxymuconolactone decarboxylase family protein [Rhodococcus sp. 1168]ORI24022.1 carboxymuconolactone decarboxylase [Rhodococcus sp. 1168]
MTAGSRVFIDKQSPTVYKAMAAAAAELRSQAADMGLDRIISELVNLRVSQINGCAFCLDVHSAAAFKAGETPQRVAVLPSWRETTLYTVKERAALHIAEAVTLVSDEHLSDEDYELVRQSLSDDEISLLILTAITINSFNRISIFSGHPVVPRPHST